jgi:hypothetical protein
VGNPVPVVHVEILEMTLTVGMMSLLQYLGTKTKIGLEQVAFRTAENKNFIFLGVCP